MVLTIEDACVRTHTCMYTNMSENTSVQAHTRKGTTNIHAHIHIQKCLGILTFVQMITIASIFKNVLLLSMIEVK